ncbi:hypothetical protein A4A49_15371 [Nicotiana attenuata]|uniref:Uncharacterized protein n=1 Tax=Nicotiana attenuata TaxID=49451 RepID=A0A314KM11_NICAT|nr:hypothetical protein A4A49_15371 [Nicotiana attenuata]
MREIRELLAEKFVSMEEKFARMSEKVNAKIDGVVDRLMKKLDRLENIIMQEMIYSTTMSWDLANFTQRMARQWNYNEPTTFPPFEFVDPSTCPMPRWYTLADLEAMAGIENSQPTPLPNRENPPPPTAPVVSDHRSKTFSNLPDLTTVFSISSPIFTPAFGGLRIREPNPETRATKKPKLGEEKGKKPMEEGDDSSDDEDGWTSVQVVQLGQTSMEPSHVIEVGESSMAQPQDEDYLVENGEERGATREK